MSLVYWFIYYICIVLFINSPLNLKKCIVYCYAVSAGLHSFSACISTAFRSVGSLEI